MGGDPGVLRPECSVTSRHANISHKQQALAGVCFHPLPSAVAPRTVTPTIPKRLSPGLRCGRTRTSFCLTHTTPVTAYDSLVVCYGNTRCGHSLATTSTSAYFFVLSTE